MVKMRLRFLRGCALNNNNDDDKSVVVFVAKKRSISEEDQEKKTSVPVGGAGRTYRRVS